MPIACCDDYAWEDNDTSYDLENLYGTNLEEYDNNCYTIGAIHTIDDNSDNANDMQTNKLGDAMFDWNDMFENLFAANNVYPKLGDAMLNEDDLFIPPTFDEQIYYDDDMPPIYDDCNNNESGFGRVSTLGNNYSTILEGVQSYNNDKSGFGEVMTLFSVESTTLEEVSIDYDENKIATYDDYCDDNYVIKSNDDYYKTCHNYE